MNPWRRSIAYHASNPRTEAPSSIHFNSETKFNVEPKNLPRFPTLAEATQPTQTWIWQKRAAFATVKNRSCIPAWTVWPPWPSNSGHHSAHEADPRVWGSDLAVEFQWEEQHKGESPLILFSPYVDIWLLLLIAPRTRFVFHLDVLFDRVDCEMLQVSIYCSLRLVYALISYSGLAAQISLKYIYYVM